MKRLTLLLLLASVSSIAFPQTTKSDQIAAAVKAAPAGQRDGAKIWGFNKDGEFQLLREGTNSTVCIADDPTKEGFNVSCYHNSLEPFMERGRQLKKEGKGFKEVFQIREEEAKSGKLKMPDKVTLHVLSGKEAYYDSDKDEVVNGNLRWVIYIPFATSESTGLPLAPSSPGAPWIMDPGTHRAHIMITPPKN